MLKPRTLIRVFMVLQSHYSCCNAVMCGLRALHFAIHDQPGYYCHSHCTDISATRGDFASTSYFGYSNTSPCLNHIRFLRVPPNIDKENSRHSWVEPPEQTGSNIEFQGSRGNVAKKTFIGDKSRNKEAEAVRKRFGLGDKKNKLVDIGSRGNVAKKTFICDKSRNKEAEAVRKRFGLQDKTNKLVDTGSHGNVATKIFIGDKSRNKEAEAVRKRFGLGDKTDKLVDIGSHGNVATKTFIGNESRNKDAEAARKRFGLGDVINMLDDLGSHGNVATKTFIGNESRNKDTEAARKRFGPGDIINMLDDLDSQSNVARKTFIGNELRNKEAKTPRKIFGLTDKTNMFVDILLRLKDSKEAIYGALDSLAACEEKFPLTVLKRALYQLEQKQQWHRVIQVIKWILSKGQAMTMETYGQLLCALDKDRRAEEAHAFWDKRIGSNLRSVPWQMCASMIYIYHRNSMPENLIKLFNDLEMHNWKPPDKAVIKKVADTYELLGLQEEQEMVLKKYESLFTASSNTGYIKKKGNKRIAMEKTS